MQKGDYMEHDWHAYTPHGQYNVRCFSCGKQKDYGEKGPPEGQVCPKNIADKTKFVYNRDEEMKWEPT